MKKRILSEDVNPDGSYSIFIRDLDPSKYVEMWNGENQITGISLHIKPHYMTNRFGREYVDHYSVRVKYSDDYKFPV